MAGNSRASGKFKSVRSATECSELIAAFSEDLKQQGLNLSTDQLLRVNHYAMFKARVDENPWFTCFRFGTLLHNLQLDAAVDQYEQRAGFAFFGTTMGHNLLSQSQRMSSNGTLAIDARLRDEICARLDKVHNFTIAVIPVHMRTVRHWGVVVAAATRVLKSADRHGEQQYRFDVYWGDSLRYNPPRNLLDTVCLYFINSYRTNCYPSKPQSRNFMLDVLGYKRQTDSYSCGFYVLSVFAHYSKTVGAMPRDNLKNCCSVELGKQYRVACNRAVLTALISEMAQTPKDTITDNQVMAFLSRNRYRRLRDRSKRSGRDNLMFYGAFLKTRRASKRAPRRSVSEGSSSEDPEPVIDETLLDFGDPSDPSGASSDAASEENSSRGRGAAGASMLRKRAEKAPRRSQLAQKAPRDRPRDRQGSSSLNPRPAPEDSAGTPSSSSPRSTPPDEPTAKFASSAAGKERASLSGNWRRNDDLVKAPSIFRASLEEYIGELFDNRHYVGKPFVKEYKTPLKGKGHIARCFLRCLEYDKKRCPVIVVANLRDDLSGWDIRALLTHNHSEGSRSDREKRLVKFRKSLDNGLPNIPGYGSQTGRGTNAQDGGSAHSSRSRAVSILPRGYAMR